MAGQAILPGFAFIVNSERSGRRRPALVPAGAGLKLAAGGEQGFLGERDAYHGVGLLCYVSNLIPLKVCSPSFFIQKHGMRFAGSRKKCGFAWAGDSSGCSWADWHAELTTDADGGVGGFGTPREG